MSGYSYAENLVWELGGNPIVLEVELECNETASILLLQASGHTKIVNVKQLW